MSHLDIGGKEFLKEAPCICDQAHDGARTCKVCEALPGPPLPPEPDAVQSLPTRDIAVERLAAAEFQCNRLLHQKEMQEIKRMKHKKDLMGHTGTSTSCRTLNVPSTMLKHIYAYLIAREWEELNKECFCRTSSTFTRICLNADRMISVMYLYDKENRLLVLEDYSRMLLTTEL